MRNKRELPLFAQVKTCDVEKFKDWMEDNKLFDMNKYSAFTPESEYYQDALVIREKFRKNFSGEKDSFDFYHGLALTGYNDERYPRVPINPNKQLSKLQLFKHGLDPNSEHYIPQLDERNYDKPGPYINGYMKEFLDSFKSPVTRVRLAWADTGYQCATHIDTSTEFSVRFHVPIITNEQAFLGFTVKGETTEKHLPADGGVWFFNHGFPHYLVNRGTMPRLHLLVSVNGQNDLDAIL